MGRLILFYLVPLVLAIYCLVNAITSRADDIRHLPKVAWILLILFFPFLGSIAWLAAGRPVAAGRGPTSARRRTSRSTTGPVAPRPSIPRPTPSSCARSASVPRSNAARPRSGRRPNARNRARSRPRTRRPEPTSAPGGTLGAVSTEPEFHYSDLLPASHDDTPYRLVTTEGVSTFEANGRTFLQVEPEAIQQLTAEAMHDISHYLRPAHLAQLRKIIDDPESSGNDRFVALDLLKNVNISAGGVLPMCQDTGTAIVMGKKSEGVQVVPIGRGEVVDKLDFRRRLVQELRFGVQLARQVRRHRPDVVMIGNAPVPMMVVVAAFLAVRRIPWVSWMQDVQGVAIRSFAGEKLGRGFGLVAAVAGRGERWCHPPRGRRGGDRGLVCRRAPPVGDGRPVDRGPELGRRSHSVACPAARDNAWARDHDLASRSDASSTRARWALQPGAARRPGGAGPRPRRTGPVGGGDRGAGGGRPAWCCGPGPPAFLCPGARAVPALRAAVGGARHR